MQQHIRQRRAEISIDALDTYKPAGASCKYRRHQNVGLSPCFCAHWPRCRPKAAMKLNNSSAARLGATFVLWFLDRTREKANSTLHKPRIDSVIVMTSERVPLLLAGWADPFNSAWALLFERLASGSGHSNRRKRSKDINVRRIRRRDIWGQ